MFTLKGRTCIFAGATGGDGIECVKELCALGMNVVMATHNKSAAEHLIAEIEAAGSEGRCVYYAENPENVTTETAASVYDDVEKRFGSVDAIISNIGTDGPKEGIEELPVEKFESTLTHLAVLAFAMMQRAVPYLKRSKAPRIVFMTTAEGVHGGTQESFANAVAKGAMASMTVNAAARLAKYGITVNCIAKGAIPRAEGVHEGEPDPADRLPSIPLGRLGTAKDLASALAFLLSEEASYVTGEILELSGGLQLGK